MLTVKIKEFYTNISYSDHYFKMSAPCSVRQHVLSRCSPKRAKSLYVLEKYFCMACAQKTRAKLDGVEERTLQNGRL